MDLPGFRFHPTEEELVGFYLKDPRHPPNDPQLPREVHARNVEMKRHLRSKFSINYRFYISVILVLDL